MENTPFSEYQVADISEEELKHISELENQISNSTREHIVLIAYKHCKADMKNEI